MNSSSNPPPDPALDAFLRRAAEYVPRASQLLPVAHAPADAVPGEVWVTHAEEEEEPLTVILLERFEGERGNATLFTAAPIFADPEMAGPFDVVLPRELFGFEAVIAFDSAGSLLSDSLQECKGALPQDWTSRLIAFHNGLVGGVETPLVKLTGVEPSFVGLTTGVPFIDEKDPAFVFHEELAESMQRLAELTLAWGTAVVAVPDWAKKLWEQMRAMAQDATAELDEWWEAVARVMFRPPLAYGMGAHGPDAGRARQMRELRVGDTGAQIGVVECVAPAGAFALTVFADPGRALENAEVLDGSGQVVTKVLGGKAVSTFRLADGVFLLRLADGTLAPLYERIE